MNRPEGEMEQVIDDERQDDRSAPHHCSRGAGRTDAVLFHILDRASGRLQMRKLNGGGHVKRYSDKQNDAGPPDDCGIFMQKLGVSVDLLTAEKDLKVS